MRNGLISKVLSISALALSAVMLTTPVLALPPVEQTSSDLTCLFYQQVWFTDHPDVVDQLFKAEYVIHDIGGDGGITKESCHIRIE